VKTNSRNTDNFIIQKTRPMVTRLNCEICIIERSDAPFWNSGYDTGLLWHFSSSIFAGDTESRHFLNRRPICVKTYKENAFTEELYSVSCTLAYNFSVRYTANLGHRESLVRTINNCNMKTATLLLQSTNRKSSCPIKQRRFRCILFSSWFNCRRDRGSTVSIV